jgi:hypothetical protein
MAKHSASVRYVTGIYQTLSQSHSVWVLSAQNGSVGFKQRRVSMITESIKDYTHVDQGQVHGQIIYTYQSPTHWGSEGVCEVRIDYGFGRKPTARLSYSAGGHNKGFTGVEIADAISEAFARAKQRLQVLSLTCNVS